MSEKKTTEAEKKTTQAPKNQKGSKADKEKKQEMSEEDLKIKSDVEMCVARVGDVDVGIVKAALEQLTNMLCATKGTVTGIPKPLKYLRAQAPALRGYLAAMPEGENKMFTADILSVVVMTLDPAQQEGGSVVTGQQQL